MKNNYNPFNTAINGECSVPLRTLIKRGSIGLGDKILDFGAGKFRDSSFLDRLGYYVVAYDKYHKIPEYRNKDVLAFAYHVLICNYVLNVIRTKKELIETIKEIREVEALRKFIAIRADIKAIKPNWIYDEIEDVYFTGRSYQRFIKEEDFQKYFGNNKILGRTSTYYLIELI